MRSAWAGTSFYPPVICLLATNPPPLTRGGVILCKHDDGDDDGPDHDDDADDDNEVDNGNENGDYDDGGC